MSLQKDILAAYKDEMVGGADGYSLTGMDEQDGVLAVSPKQIEVAQEQLTR